VKIAVVGSINMDMTVKTERIPLAGETVKGEDLCYIPGGKGANQAAAMAKLGADVEMFGCVGEDEAGAKLLKDLEESGVGTKWIRKSRGVPTGLAMITAGEGDNTIVVVAGANDSVTPEYIDSVRENLLEADIVILQHEIPAETNKYVIRLFYENHKKIVLNPGPARPVSQEIIDKITYLTPNEHEAAIIFGTELSTEELLRKYPEKLLITMGSKGVAIRLLSGGTLLVPARPAKVVDTTGAGDTLNGAFTVQIAEGRSVEEALTFANVAASLSTEKFGTRAGMPTYKEVLDEIERTRK